MRAVQRTESFTTDELRRMRLVVRPGWGVPSPAKGSNAAVFKATIDGESQALRFFTRHVSSAERYRALHDHFAANDLAATVAMPRWIDDGITVNGTTWPVVRMQWVEGHTLNLHVDKLVTAGDTGSLAALARSWRDLVSRLQHSDFAHGDLQHGNVLVNSGGTLRLVDFDCSWIARFPADWAPNETGHRNYQPASRPWGRWMDTFSGLVIYLSLLALSKNPSPWRELNTEENLLLSENDFRPPFDTDAWTCLAGMREPELDEVASRLKHCCAPGWTATGSLDDLLAPRVAPWWERTSTVVSPAVPPAAAPMPAPAIEPVVPRPRVESGPTPVGPPTAQWWRDEVPTRTPAPAWRPPYGAPPPKKPTVPRIFAVALALGLFVGLVAGAATRGSSDEGAIEAVLALLTMAIVVVVGLARRG